MIESHQPSATQSKFSSSGQPALCLHATRRAQDFMSVRVSQFVARALAENDVTYMKVTRNNVMQCTVRHGGKGVSAE